MKHGLNRIIKILHDLRLLKRVAITMCGKSSDRYIFDSFTKQHNKYIFIKNKTIGVALIELPDQFDVFLKGSHMINMRNKRNRAIKLGYIFKQINRGIDYRDDIISINKSSEYRDGRKMSTFYLDIAKVEDYILNYPIIYGIFDRYAKLQAYTQIKPLGEVCVICRIIGHKDFLADGIMYLLVSELIKELKKIAPKTKYLMYDTIIGAHPGIHQFKERTGFSPFWVKWKWETIDD